MTLLVLDVKLPNDAIFATDHALVERLLSLEHTFVIYFISFIVLGMFWVGHHAHFHFIRYVDHTLLWINLLFLFGITSVPFATDLLGDHYQLRLPYIYYSVKIMVLAGLLIGQIAYLRRHPELARPSLTREVARQIVLRTALFAAIPLLSIGSRVLQYEARPVPLFPAPGRAFPAGACRHARDRRSRTKPNNDNRCPLMKRVLILGVNGFIGHHLSQRIIADTDWEIYGMDMQSDRVTDLLSEKRFHFFEGDITINKEWIEYHIKKCDTVLPLVAIATPATYVKEPLRVFELDFEANLPIVRACVRYRKRIIFPSTSEVYGMCRDDEFDSGALRARAGADQQAALDLLVREAADGPRDPRLRDAGGARLHAVPAVQLDRRGARLDQHREGRQLARHHAVPRPHRPRRDDQAGRRRHAEARVHLHRRRHRRADEDHRQRRRRSRPARSTTSATRPTTSRCASSRR